MFRQANAQGVTILASSGDEGAAGCEAHNAKIATHGLAIIAPASIPYVTGVGGTTFDEDNWNPKNNRAGGSVLSYMSEVAWNDTWLGGPLEASGGGKTAFFKKPAWQNGPGVPNDGARDVPDVALAASPNHDGYLICSAGSCANGFWSSTGTLDIIGGTSASAPAMAGIVALLDQAYSGPQSNINAELYRLASLSRNSFHAVGSGDNSVPCTVGTPDCSTGREGYSAGFSYDQVTGLGSVDTLNLVAAWGEPNPVTIPTVPFSGSLVAAPDGSLWNIDAQRHPVTYNPQTLSWTEISNLEIAYLWVGSSGAMWARDPSGKLYRWDPASQTFGQVPGAFFSMSVGADGDTWAIQSPPNAIFHFDPSTKSWVLVPGELNQIAAGNDGAVWGINAYGQIFRFNPGSRSFEYVPGSLTNIYVGPDGGVWGINWAESTYHFNTMHQSWDQFGASMAALAVGSDTNVWAWDHYGVPYKFSSVVGAWYSPYRTV